MTSTYGPCQAWPVSWICDVSCVDPVITGAAVDMATDVVWSMSGQRFGLCEVALRPCREDCVDAPYLWNEFLPSTGAALWPRPALVNGQWWNITCGSCSGSCSCARLHEVMLPNLVDSIIEVKVDGSVLDPSAYRVDDGRKLVRIDGGEWPWCNDLSKADTEVGTWSVTAQYGQAVPAGGGWAVGELACELIKAMQGEDCRLPKQVVALARQGVTMQFPSVTELFKEGRTGLYLVDLFLQTWNPNRLRSRSRTYRVDGAPPRRTGTA